MKKVSIKGTGSCIPDRIVPNSYFKKIVDTSDEWIIARTGIQTRRMIEPGQALTDLATPASEHALETAGISPKKLDIIIVGTSTADMLSPSAACILQHRLGAQNAVAFDVNAACPGFIYGLAVAQKFMQDGSHHHALVVGGKLSPTGSTIKTGLPVFFLVTGQELLSWVTPMEEKMEKS